MGGMVALRRAHWRRVVRIPMVLVMEPPPCLEHIGRGAWSNAFPVGEVRRMDRRGYITQTRCHPGCGRSAKCKSNALRRHLFDNLKVGFRLEGGPIRDRWLKDGRWHSVMRYGLIEGEER